MPTPHINAKLEDIAETVLMPGDPLRAKFFAEKFLENIKLVNTVRNMFAYTGTYKNKKVTIMGSGMGMPSMGIYSYELFTQYNVKNIIRIGTCGAYNKDLKIHDVVIGLGASTDSNYAHHYNLPGIFSATASFELVEKAVKAAKEKKANYHVGNILSSDVFYRSSPAESLKAWQKLNVLAVEMEAYALYTNAAETNKNALTILTVSDSLVTHETTTSEEREKTLIKMVEIALELI